jgi:GDPmannose 4,6-dehydratase
MVIGCGGQDGSYIAEHLVAHGYAVLGVLRGNPSRPVAHLDAVIDQIDLAWVDLSDTPRLVDLIRAFQPDEIYNLAAVSFGPDAWADPQEAVRVGGVALAGLLDAVRDHAPMARLFQASSSWVFGHAPSSPQNEHTAYQPSDPYGATKAYGDFLIRAYRARYGLFLSVGILFNHESPRRSERFVTRKITAAAARIAAGRETHVALGDLTAQRDWGFAKDYMDCAWRSLQVDEPGDWVIGTGTLHSVLEIAERAFTRLGLEWQEHVTFDTVLTRSAIDVPALVADSSRAQAMLDWTPSVPFEELIDLMVDADVTNLNSI